MSLAPPDLSGWPLPRLDARSAPVDVAPRLVAAFLQAAVARSEPFAAVLQLPAHPPRRGGAAGAGERVRLLRGVRPGLRRHCRGLAFVLPEPDQRAARAGDRLWGCPTLTLDDADRACRWAHDQLDRAVG